MREYCVPHHAYDDEAEIQSGKGCVREWRKKEKSMLPFSCYFRYDNLLSFRCDKLSDEKIM